MTVVDLYTIQIIKGDVKQSVDPNDVASMMAEAEENMNDLLPKGWSVRVRKWDHPGTEDENDE